MHLESVFPNYYELHHDIGIESDVRYILHPDNMMGLLRFKYPYDIEFDNNTVWIIAKGYCMSENDLRSQLQFASKN